MYPVPTRKVGTCRYHSTNPNSSGSGEKILTRAGFGQAGLFIILKPPPLQREATTGQNRGVDKVRPLLIQQYYKMYVCTLRVSAVSSPFDSKNESGRFRCVDYCTTQDREREKEKGGAYRGERVLFTKLMRANCELKLNGSPALRLQIQTQWRGPGPKLGDFFRVLK